MSVSQFYLLLYCSFNHPKEKRKKKQGFWFGLGTPIGRFFLLNISTHRHTYGRTWTRLVGWSPELQSLCCCVTCGYLGVCCTRRLGSSSYQLIMFAASCFTLRAITRFQSVPGLFLPLWQPTKKVLCVWSDQFFFLIFLFLSICSEGIRKKNLKLWHGGYVHYPATWWGLTIGGDGQESEIRTGKGRREQPSNRSPWKKKSYIMKNTPTRMYRGKKKSGFSQIEYKDVYVYTDK